MPNIYYDLTELFYAMNAKVKYYGIARTVMEVGFELSRISGDVRFVVFSPSHDAFFEVNHPQLGSAAENGVLDLGFPPAARPARLRRSRAHNQSSIAKVDRFVRRIADRRKWNLIPNEAVSRRNLDGELLVSLGQPRIVSDYLFALKERGETPRLLVLLHDLIPLHETKTRKYNANFLQDNSYLLSSGASILANSEFTRSEICMFTEAGALPPASSIHVLPLAHEFRAALEQLSPPSFQDYFLCVGSLPGRKNLECVLNALVELHVSGSVVPNLVLAGSFRKRIASMIDTGRFGVIKDKVHFAIDPSQEELEQLYRNAIATILPSFIEGWGLPAAESLWLGTPAIVSDIPVMREVGGELAIYFDPNDPRALAGKMLDVMQDAGLKEKVRDAQPTLRSWQRVAQDLLSIIEAA